jgi:hypothetical protein
MNPSTATASAGSARDRRRSRSLHRNREMLMIWSFVVFSFAAFIAAGYGIWAKCSGN